MGNFYYRDELVDAMLPRKAARVNNMKTVVQTDTGRQVENTKAMR